MDASDYLKTPEVKAQMDRIRAKVLNDSREHPEKYQGRLRAGCGADPEAIEQEINRQQMALREELMYDLPDLYLSPEEVRERRLADLEGIPEELWPDLPEGWLDGR